MPEPTGSDLFLHLAFELLAAALLTAVVSPFLIGWYRRAVVRWMDTSARPWSGANPAAPAWPTPPPPADPTGLRLAIAPESAPSPSHKLFRAARLAPWRSATVYCVAGACATAVMTLAYFPDILPLQFIVIWWVFLGPVVLTAFLVAGPTRREKVLLVAAYVLGFLLTAMIGWMVAIGEKTGSAWFIDPLMFFLMMNIPLVLLYLFFLRRKIRAVGPLVLAFLFFSVVGANLAKIVPFSEGTLRGAVALGQRFGLGGYEVFAVSLLIGLLAFGVIGWLILTGARRLYRSKRMSDQSITIDSWWLIVLAGQSVLVAANRGAVWLLAGVVAFLTYKAIAGLGFTLLRRLGGSRNNVRLLVLRVFALGDRSARLFEAVALHWRHLGSVQLIAGSDLATTTVSPHEFLDFVSGRLRRQFIDGPDALARRIADMDLQPDPDGRFRVNDFFCHADTWQMALSALVRQTDVVLMDLRSFSPRRTGCIQELHELVQAISLQQVLFVVDETTDLPFLETTLAAAWASLPPSSPNRTPAEIRTVRLSRAGASSLPLLLQNLCWMAGRQ